MSMADVESHNTQEDVWMVIHDKVYNVTKYLDDHPGGEEVLMDRAGQNATEDFEDVGHSRDARKQLDKFEVGELAPSERVGSTSKGGGGGSGEGGGAMPLILVSVLVAVVGAAYFYYSQETAAASAAAA